MLYFFPIYNHFTISLSLNFIYFTTITKQVIQHFYNDYETSYTTYINHARWHRCLRSDGLRVEGHWSARRKPTCLTW